MAKMASMSRKRNHQRKRRNGDNGIIWLISGFVSGENNKQWLMAGAVETNVINGVMAKANNGWRWRIGGSMAPEIWQSGNGSLVWRHLVNNVLALAAKAKAAQYVAISQSASCVAVKSVKKRK
jgi:hypothetical protein